MNENDHKETDSDETETEQETSRRDLLAAGAAAMVGMTAVVAASGEAKAHGRAPGVYQRSGEHEVRVSDISYAANEGLSKDLQAITMATWFGFDKKMGTGAPENIPKEDVEDALRDSSLATVRAMMNDIVKKDNHGGGGGAGNPNQEFEVEKPKFITIEDYEAGYVKQAPDEVVFVLLPKPPGTETSNNKKGGSIRALMAAVPFGM